MILIADRSVDNDESSSRIISVTSHGDVNSERASLDPWDEIEASLLAE